MAYGFWYPDQGPGGGTGVVTSVAGKTGDVSLSKNDVGLDKVDNVADLDKPVSNPTQAKFNTMQAAVDLKEPAITKNTAFNKDFGTGAGQVLIGSHGVDTNNPHAVTKAQVGLANADNTSDADKPISDATQTALDKKVDKSPTKDLSTNDFTNALLVKLNDLKKNTTVVRDTPDADDTLAPTEKAVRDALDKIKPAPDEATKKGHMLASYGGVTGDAEWSPINLNPQATTSDITIPSGVNGSAVGPFLCDGVLTISAGSTFAII